MNYICPKCKKTVIREDKRKKYPYTIRRDTEIISYENGEPCQVRCGNCDKVVTLRKSNSSYNYW